MLVWFSPSLTGILFADQLQTVPDTVPVQALKRRYHSPTATYERFFQLTSYWLCCLCVCQRSWVSITVLDRLLIWQIRKRRAGTRDKSINPISIVSITDKSGFASIYLHFWLLLIGDSDMWKYLFLAWDVLWHETGFWGFTTTGVQYVEESTAQIIFWPKPTGGAILWKRGDAETEGLIVNHYFHIFWWTVPMLK